jgi:hypothetical protein
MTEEEALDLEPGDEVEVLLRGGPGRGHWAPARVLYTRDFRGLKGLPSARQHVCVRVRAAPGTPTPPGVRITNHRSFESPRVRLPLTRLDPVPANVYADFLEEHGHAEAAALLRKAFPLADGRAPG